ncbi:ubiquitin-2 like rad60 SUMO-like domain-containing protein [Phthorimaea operculella]|nr:ubiquitin-2 like rad60 SUMO-like domain-containing protein [Phthorimaea operculella]
MSSDSEDDFYDNVTERLQKEKDKFQFEKEEKPEIEDSLFDDSGALDEIVKNNKLPPKRKRKTASKEPEVTPESSVNDLPDVSVDNVSKTTTKRVTRSRAKASSTVVSTDAALPPTRAKRQKKNTPSAPEPSLSAPNIPSITEAATSASITQEAGLSVPSENSWDPSIPTYSVGNTMEYPDQSYQQPLFSSSSKPKANENVVEVEDEIPDEDNEELSVKVYWQSSEFFKFTIRKFQKLTQVFDYFSKKENVTHDKLLFTYNEKILKPDDTPDSIDYSIVKFIDGGIVTQNVTKLLAQNNENIKGGIKIKFQCQNVKRPFEITVRPEDKLSYAMMQCAEHLEKPLDKLKFEFDGDSITGKTTARELEFEGGECIDVRILS